MTKVGKLHLEINHLAPMQLSSASKSKEVWDKEGLREVLISKLK